MAKTDPDTVILGYVDEDAYKEGEADGTITPGDLLTQNGENASGAKTQPTYVRNGNDGTKIVPAVAVAAERGGVGRGIDDDYSDGDELSYVVLEPGDEAYLFVFDGANAGGAGTDLSANANIALGDRLVAYSGSGQDGTLRAFDGDNEGAALFEAKEAVDASGASSPQRIKVEAL